MKTITLFVASVFLMGSSVKASEKIDFEVRYPVAVAEAEPIVFTERGIEFFVFADGQIDFNTVPTVGTDDGYYYRKGRRGQVNATYGAPGVNNGGVRIEHDNQGRVRRVGNVFLNYDARGRVKRIGSVYMSYNRYALMQVGGLTILYDRYGRIVGTQGRVNSSWNNQYQSNHGGGYQGGNWNSNDDEEYYYYKQNGEKAKMEPKAETRK